MKAVGAAERVRRTTAASVVAAIIVLALGVSAALARPELSEFWGDLASQPPDQLTWDGGDGTGGAWVPADGGAADRQGNAVDDPPPGTRLVEYAGHLLTPDEEFGAAVIARLSELCDQSDATIAGESVLVVCPDDLGVVAATREYLFVAGAFGGAIPVPIPPGLQVSLVWIRPGDPTYTGAANDPNTGHNDSLDIYNDGQRWLVARTTYRDGDFTFAPTDLHVGFIGPDWVGALIALDPLEGQIEAPELWTNTDEVLSSLAVPFPPAVVLTGASDTPPVQPTETVGTASPDDGATGVVEPTDAASDPDDVAGGPATTTEDGGIPALLLLVALGLIVVALLLYVLFTRRRPGAGEPPLGPTTTGTTTGPGPTGVAPPGGAGGCTCTVSVAIEGPATIAVCCMKPEYSTNEVQDPDSDVDEADPSQVHLDANVEGEDGWDLFDVILKATITAECSGGGEARIEDATYSWAVTSDDKGVSVTCEVSVPVHCPDGVEHPEVTGAAMHTITYVEQPCRIGVVVQQTPMFEISHVDVHIICGVYSEVFGYFAKEAGWGVFTGTPGYVARFRDGAAQTLNGPDGPLTKGLVDGIGKDYNVLYGKEQLEVFWITPSSCEKCIDLRRMWEAKADDPQDYHILTNNCATNVWESLEQAGFVPDHLVDAHTPTAVSNYLTTTGADDSTYGISPPQAVPR